MNTQSMQILHRDLSDIHRFLKDQGIECLFSPATQPLNLDLLLVSIGKDLQNRDYILQMNYIPIPSQMQSQLPKEPKRDFSFMQFVVKLPFTVLPIWRQEAMDLLYRINGMMELPGFQFNPVTDELFFRYVYFSFEDTTNTEWMLSLIVYIKTVLDLFAPSIEDISRGRTTINGLIRQWQGTTMDDLKEKIRKL